MKTIALKKLVVSAVMILYVAVAGLTHIVTNAVAKATMTPDEKMNYSIKEEVSNLFENYSQYEKEYAKTWVDNQIADQQNENHIRQSIDDMRKQCIEKYNKEKLYTKVKISSATIEYMTTTIPKEKEVLINSLSGSKRNEIIIEAYLSGVLMENIK